MDRIERVFAPRRTDVRAARQFVRKVVGQWDLRTDEAELVVGELAANAVVHAHSGFKVTLERSADVFVIEVSDDSPEQPAKETTSVSATSGRGLLIVDRLSKAWGSRDDRERGKTVWAELDVDRH